MGHYVLIINIQEDFNFRLKYTKGLIDCRRTFNDYYYNVLSTFYITAKDIRILLGINEGLKSKFSNKLFSINFTDDMRVPVSNIPYSNRNQILASIDDEDTLIDYLIYENKNNYEVIKN